MPPTIVRDHQQRLVETMLEIARQQKWWSAPINLGGGPGGGGGSGIPVGGFAGQLIQSKVAYDTTESTDPTLPPSGRSLVHNLNKIRYDITQISGGGGSHTLGSATHTDVTITSVDDDDILAYDSGGDWINQTAAEAGLATAGHAHSDVVDVSADDTTAGYLEDKIVQGNNITITVLNEAGDEDLEIAATGLSISGHLHIETDITDLSHDAVKIRGRDVSTDAPVVGEAYRWSGSEWIPSGVAGGAGDTKKVLVSANDTTEDYLEDKIVAGTNITVTTLNEGGNETVEIISTASGGGGSAIIVRDEGVTLTSGVTSLDFVGGGATATTVGDAVTVTIPSGAGGSGSALVVTSGTFYVEEVISELTLTGASGIFSVSDIPQTYDSLRLEIFAGTNRSGNSVDAANITFNDDTGSNYSYQRAQFESAAGYSEVETANFIQTPYILTGATSPANAFGSVRLHIPNYTNAEHKMAISSDAGGRPSTTNKSTGVSVGIWKDTDAVTSIDVVPTNGPDFNSGSTFRLVGIRKQSLITSVEGGGGGTGTYDLLYTYTGDGTDTQVDIPITPAMRDNYQTLHFTVLGDTDRVSQLDGLRIQFAPSGGSVDTGGNYYRYTREWGDGNTIEEHTAGDSLWAGRYCMTGSTADNPGSHARFSMQGWNNAVTTTSIEGKITGFGTTSLFRVADFWGAWRNASAVGTVRFYSDTTSNFTQYTTIKMYGAN